MLFQFLAAPWLGIAGFGIAIFDINKNFSLEGD